MDLRRASAIGLSVALCWPHPTALGGEFHGTVVLEGPIPAPEAMALDHPKEQHALKECGGQIRYSQRLVVDPSGGVSSAVAWLDPSTSARDRALSEVEGLDAPSLLPESSQDATAVLDQQGCTFAPHVLVVPLGGALTIRNSDPVLHNVRIFRDGTMLMHEWQQPRAADRAGTILAGEEVPRAAERAADLTWRFNEPGRFLVRCGVHPWMYAWVVITAHRHAGVTDATGRVIISQVPEGAYTLHVWHETLGEAQRQVTIGEQPTMVVVRMTDDTTKRRSP